jgi:YVTN family beta-propeller protein
MGRWKTLIAQGQTAFVALSLCATIAIPTAWAATCQFNQTMGAWNVPANWNGCSMGNGLPAGTPGPADRAEVTMGNVAIVPTGTFPVLELFVQGGTVQGSGIGATTITTAGSGLTMWGNGNNTISNLSLNLGAGAGIDTSPGVLFLNNAKLTTNGGTTFIGAVNANGTGAGIELTGGTAYRANGNHTFASGASFINTAGVFRANVTTLTFDGPFQNGGGLELPASVDMQLVNASLFSMTNAGQSLIFGQGSLSAPGQVLQLAMGAVRGNLGPGLTFNVGTLHSLGAALRPAPNSMSVGLLTINGDLSLTGTASVNFNLNGTMPSEYDRIVVSGTANLGGGLDRQALGTFAPPVGTLLDVITASSVMGTFSSGSGSIAFDTPRRFLEQYTATQVRLRANETVWVVGSNDDLSGTAASLRNALTRFNAESSASCANAPYSIHFLLPMGSETTTVSSDLPIINGCPGLLIDGYTQPGAAMNSAPGDFNAVLPVVLDGSACSGCRGIGINAPNTTVRGLRIRDFDMGIGVSATANFTQISGNHISGGSDGIGVAGANGTQIGGTLAERNVITGSAHGIEVSNASFALKAPPLDSVNQRAPALGNDRKPNATTRDATGEPESLAPRRVPQVAKGAAVEARRQRGGAGESILTVPAPAGTVLIANNFIGVGPGLTMAGNSAGVFVDDINNVNIQNNVIRHNQYGVIVNTASQVDFSQNNVIAANTTIGVDLGFDGATANDDAMPPYDTDSGPNARLNFPRPLSFTMVSGGMGTLNYELKSTASSNFDVCVCRNPSGGSQCEQPGPCTSVSTDATGLFTGSLALTGMVAGTPVTMLAKATSGPKAGNVSEISPGLNFAAGGPVLTITGSGAFPNVTEGAVSAVQTITLQNTGGANLTLNTISYLGNSGLFIDTTSGAPPSAAHYCGFGSTMTGAPSTGAPIVLLPMQSCQLNMVFKPDALAMFMSSLTIQSDAPGSPHTVNLTGQGIAPTFTLGPALNFGNIPVGQSSAPQTVTFTNTSPVTLTVTAGPSSGGMPFSVTPSGATPCGIGLPIASMGSCTFSAVFTPPGVAMYGNTLSLSVQAVTTTFTATSGVSGNGVSLAAPTVSVGLAPTSISAGGVSTLTIAISNPNATAVTGFSLNLTYPAGLVNAPAPNATASGPVCTSNSNIVAAPGSNTYAWNTTGVGIGAMETCTLQVTLTAAAGGMYTVNVAAGQVMSAAGTNSAAASATLTVIAPTNPTLNVAFAPTSVMQSTNSTLTLTLNNPGAMATTVTLGSAVTTTGLTLSGLVDGCGLGAFLSGGTIDLGMGGSLPAMSSCTITVQAQSAMAGMYTVNVAPGNLITSPAGNNTNTSTATLNVTVAATGPYAYIANFGNFTGTTVTAIDLSTNTAATNIPVGTGPVGVTVNYAGTRAYVSNQQSNSISVIDTATNTVVATIPVGSQPASSGINPAGTRLFVPNQTSNSVSVIDTSTNTVVATIPSLSFPSSAVVNPAGTKVYVNQSSSNLLTAIDASTNAVLGSVSVCSGPYQQVVNATGTRIYVVCSSGNVAVVDSATFTVLATIPVGTTSRGIAITPNGAQVWVSNSGSNNVSVIDTTTNTVVATVAAGTTPWGVAGNAAGTRMYVVNNGSNTVSVFDTASNTLVATVPTGTAPLTIGQFLQPAAVAANPLVILSAATRTFGSQTINTTSPASTVTLSNGGTANLVITNITTSGDFGFTTTCPISTPPIAPASAPCNINVTFTPLTIGALNGTLTIVSNAPGSPHTVALSGTGSPVAVPGISLTASTIDTGPTTINTTSVQQSVGVTNTGLATLNITSITVSGPFGRVVPLTGTNCGASLAPMGSCRIAVACSPTVIGTVTGTLTIAHSAMGSPTVVNLSCTGTPVPVAMIALPGAVDFGDQIINVASAPRTVQIDNTGTAALNVSRVTVGGTHASEFAVSGSCTGVNAASTCPLLVTFTPGATGARSANLTVTSDAQNAASVNSVLLSGNGVLAPRPVPVLNVTGIGFGNTIFGGASSPQSVVLKNEGGQAMAISSILATGEYVTSHNCGASLGPQATCNIAVSFTPTGIGGRSGELQVFSNAQGSPHKVLLNGTGCRWFAQPNSRFFLTTCG